MKSRFGPGFYLGCTKYPKCKGKGQVSAELKRRIDAAAAAPAWPFASNRPARPKRTSVH
jgi:DNA topoisomerase I